MCWVGSALLKAMLELDILQQSVSVARRMQLFQPNEKEVSIARCTQARERWRLAGQGQAADADADADAAATLGRKNQCAQREKTSAPEKIVHTMLLQGRPCLAVVQIKKHHSCCCLE